MDNRTRPTLIFFWFHRDCTNLSVIVLAAVFLLIAVRQVGRYRIRIWQIMFCGALAVLLMRQISITDAVRAINVDVMIFLFGMFVVGEALLASGYLDLIARQLFHHTISVNRLVFAIILCMGMLSTILMNDTLAIIGTPLVIALSARSGISPKLLLITLAVAVTTGSVMSPIGNPQNLLVAVNGGMQAPFVTFARYLAIPTIINFLVAFAVVKIFFKKEFHPRPVEQSAPAVCDIRLMRICQVSLITTIILIAANVTLSLSGNGPIITLPVIALCAAAPILILSERRIRVIRGIDWYTLVFFAAMFVLMQSVWQSGFFQSFVDSSMVRSIPLILVTSVIISQFISNVPFVALFLPMIQQAGGTPAQMVALAAGSTIAGNLTILGAASNVIIIQIAENQKETLTFIEFAKVGVPLTVLQVAVYWAFLAIV